MFFLENRDDFNELPSRRDMQKAPTFWNLMSGLLFGSEPTHYEATDPGLERMRRMQAGYDALNEAARGEAPKPSAVREIADELVDHVKSAVAKVRAPTKLSLAVTWLAGVLQHGPVPQVDVESRGRDAGYTPKMLKQAKAKLRAASARKGRNHWVWLLPMAQGPKNGQR